MAHRGTESPMDFEWQGHGTGPVDVSSPFHCFTMKRTHSQLESPLGKGNLPSLPSLAEPNGRPWFFSNMPTSPPPPQTQTQTQTQMSPFRSPSFTTPRKPFDIDFSSGPESSPADQLANNDDTPDSKPFEFKSNNSNGNDTTTNPGGKRNSLFGMYGKFAPSPTALRKPFNDALEKRIHKRRRRAQDFSVSKEIVLSRRSSNDTDDDNEGEGSSDGDNDGDDDDTLSSLKPVVVSKRSPSKSVQTLSKKLRSHSQQRKRQAGAAAAAAAAAVAGGGGEEQEKEGLLTRIFTFLTTYPSAPAIIAKYLQILSNVFIFTCVFYLLYSAISTIRNDIDRLADETVSEILAEMSTCSKNYIENRCAADTRLPALETVCSNWEICMQRDPNAVKRARLSAHTLADILNGFVEPISWKTMGVMFAGLVLVLLVTNGTFTLYRRQYEEQNHHHVYWQQQQQPGPERGMQQQQYLHPSGGSYAAAPLPPYISQPSPWVELNNDNDTYPAEIMDQAHHQQRLVEWRRNANGSPSKRFRATPSSPEKKKPRI